jgi:GntR family transcriptional regulator, carbon starvation induced regulator
MHESAPVATDSDYVLDRLRADIAHGVYEPHARLAMKDLSARYEVGTSPLREALHRLAGEGFVQFTGQRGFRVPELSVADLDDLTDLRKLVEEAAARQAIARGDDAWEAGVVAAFHLLERQAGRFGRDDEESMRLYDDVHRQFHVALYASVVAPRLRHLHANLYDQAFRYRSLLYQEPISQKQVLAEHRGLMKRVLSRDVEGAVELLLAHLELTRVPVRRRLQRLHGG